MASKKMDKLKQAGAEMDKFFSGAEQDKEEKILLIQPEKRPDPVPTPKVEPVKKIQFSKDDSKEEPGKKGKAAEKTQKKVFSFRANVDLVDSWRVWADARGVKVDELGELALREYIKRHPLTEDQQKIYELKLAQKKP